MSSAIFFNEEERDRRKGEIKISVRRSIESSPIPIGPEFQEQRTFDRISKRYAEEVLTARIVQRHDALSQDARAGHPWNPDLFQRRHLPSGLADPPILLRGLPRFLLEGETEL